uniref:Tctex1 domain-containing protein 2 n=1 Tax=Chromera velia CCMP2878 TaxID=1169474 RepID=A0A0G4GVB5_9ALVE|mmetsp:Transcript_20363/g.40781  ORF Transcript_20363/g.40781 Transcript_20363/m.40781 type:complete len:129 (+) Transcript_20363:260-646(+)|eukprot:Cvel_23536.t1-p1 / transcript=Cvel_23536.t1 / gene=Cvel_23536 / organism=Chromera_velia_CCMP2878 / gene_product=Tctex1 domain-containing protein 2, putative / transcript_product=Tctex1 domain-containing protein 2, putative / location=Cvel_scaffold2436:12237-14474(+) / protein_length=128 / sequence_SO=supercontig / SO=protein_coding / is_pseudo=false
MDKKKIGGESTYEISPAYKDKFRPQPVKQIIKEVLNAKLSKVLYEQGKTETLTKLLADEIKDRIREHPDLKMPRYKIIVQVIIGEQRGQGIRMGARCFWDCDTDAMASETFHNETLFCVATAFGVYHY